MGNAKTMLNQVVHKKWFPEKLCNHPEDGK